MTKVTVVIEYDENEHPGGFAFGPDMLTEDLPDGLVTAVYFGDALNEQDKPRE